MLNLCAPERTVRRNTHLALVLTAIAGILNSVGFVAVATYTSHMTGIVASMADAAVLHAPGLVGTGLLALAMFILGAVVCALVFNWGRVNGLRSRYANILLLEGVGMLVFGLLAEHVRDAHRPLVVVAVLCFTMGLQNALITRIGAWPIRTTHVTGMVTDIGVELGKILYRNGPRRRGTAARGSAGAARGPVLPGRGGGRGRLPLAGLRGGHPGGRRAAAHRPPPADPGPAGRVAHTKAETPVRARPTIRVFMP